MISRPLQRFVLLALLMLIGIDAQATWYDYAFAKTSAQKDAEGNSISKPNDTPLPNLPQGLTKATITLDGSGNLYAAYFLENPDLTITKSLIPHLTWTKWSKNVWTEQTATLHTDITSPQVAVDSMGNAFLFYLNNGNLEYALWSEANQSFDPTRTAIYPDEYVAQVSYDSVNQKPRPQVTYLDKGSVKHAFIFPETESESVIEVKSGVFSSLSMAIDATGSPHILYHDSGEDANRNGKLDSDEDIDGDGEFDEGSRNLKYATYDSVQQGFVRYTLAAGHEAGSKNSIAISSNGNIHACYYDAKRLELRYLKRNISGTWGNPQTVDNNWVNGGLNHLATDANGNVHISYLGYYGYNVKYATNRTGSWTNEIIQTTNEQDHFLGTAIAADKDGHPHILTIENEIKYLHYITTTTEKVPLVDSDNDGATDLEEKLLDTDPLHPDSDGDGLTDGEEQVLKTDPNKIDSDEDGLTDAKEEELGLDPNDPTSDKVFAQALALTVDQRYPQSTFKTSPYTEGWFYTTDMGWLYTSPDSFPYIYKPDEGAWFFFQEGTSAPRWFFNTKTGVWDQR